MESERDDSDAHRPALEWTELGDSENRASATADATVGAEAAAGADAGDPTDAEAEGRSGEVLRDPERLSTEHQAYLAIVRRGYTPAGDRQWSQAVPELRDAWEKIKEKYGYEERDEPTRQADDGTWRGQGGRTLDAGQNDEVDRGYARIREIGERRIIPGVLSVEAGDDGRHLAGFDRCFKGIDRLKEKIADRIRSKGLSSEEALSRIPDVVRFTYEYDESTYASGVPRDVRSLEASGFVQLERRNTWDDDQYKGINSRWREQESGVMFEVQFHTYASREAKELTHKAYERLRSITARTPEADRETAELKEFQRRVNSMIPIPPGVADIDDYPPGGN